MAFLVFSNKFTWKDCLITGQTAFLLILLTFSGNDYNSKNGITLFFFENKKQCFTIFRSILNSGIPPHTEYKWSCTVHKEYKSLNYLFDNNKLFVLCELHTAVKLHLWRTFSGFFFRGSAHADINTISWKFSISVAIWSNTQWQPVKIYLPKAEGLAINSYFYVYLWFRPGSQLLLIYLQAMSSTYSFHISSVQCAPSSLLIKHIFFSLINWCWSQVEVTPSHSTRR
jgi:hypothetical protein